MLWSGRREEALSAWAVQRWGSQRWNANAGRFLAGASTWAPYRHCDVRPNMREGNDISSLHAPQCWACAGSVRQAPVRSDKVTIVAIWLTLEVILVLQCCIAQKHLPARIALSHVIVMLLFPPCKFESFGKTDALAPSSFLDTRAQKLLCWRRASASQLIDRRGGRVTDTLRGSSLQQCWGEARTDLARIRRKGNNAYGAS